MNVNKQILFYVIFFYSIFAFSQKKEDVYFIMNKNSKEYLITGDLNSFIDYITIYNRKEYEYRKKKIKEAKGKDKYFFYTESGRDNLNISVSKLTFKVISKKKTQNSEFNFNKLKIIDYNWLLTEGWKQINGKEPDTNKPLSFESIYFLSKIDRDNYFFYKVEITLTEH